MCRRDPGPSASTPVGTKTLPYCNRKCSLPSPDSKSNATLGLVSGCALYTTLILSLYMREQTRGRAVTRKSSFWRYVTCMVIFDARPIHPIHPIHPQPHPTFDSPTTRHPTMHPHAPPCTTSPHPTPPHHAPPCTTTHRGPWSE